ncbi:MAG TPA: FAD-dependent oxidoreductase, partial [Bacteroidota bacterium]|nr:FAD-dependent oxidoreductase [Bacteroidota bacterium]
MTTRREFLRQSALATASVLVSRPLLGDPLPMRPRVIVLGAGLSGLAAAYALAKERCEVTILEARNRIGGRVLSHEIDSDKNLIIELGAEWIGNSHERMIALCRELELETFNNQFETHLIYKNDYRSAGQWNYESAWASRFEELLNAFNAMPASEKRRLDRTDWWRYLMNNGISQRDLDLRELADSTDFGESIRHVSAYSAITEYAESSPKNEMDLKIRGGNSRLPQALAQRIGMDRIKLQHRVVSVRQERKSVTATCENGA